VAIVVFSKPVAFPIAPLRDLLAKHLPLYRWQVGEQDRGDAKQMGSFADNSIISGRSRSTVILTELRPMLTQAPEAPVPHEWFVQIGAPTTEERGVADRLALIICMTIMILDQDHAHCQLAPGGNWLTPDELLRAFKLVLNGETLELAAGLGKPSRDPASAAPTPAPGAKPHQGALQAADPAVDLPGSELSAMVVLADRHVPIDRRSLERMARELDPDGDWRIEDSRGQAILVGRGTVVGVIEAGAPLPAQYFAGSWERSFWFKGDRRAVERHVRHVTVKAMLNTRKADYVTVRQVAKIVTLAACWIARQPGALAIVNLDVGTIFESAMGRTFLGHLGRDELAVALWTWTKPDSMADGDVSLSTSGLLPFVGHELETWHAPIDCAVMAEQFGDLIRYLLASGPVIGHGDSAGRHAGDQSIRCFLGPSRADRPQPVQALILEVETPEVAAPRPDLPVTGGDSGAVAQELIDGALRDMIRSSASPAMAKVLGDVLGERGGAAAPTAPPAPVRPMPPAAGPGPVRRLMGFGRKGL
jgi:hypothetical protein